MAAGQGAPAPFDAAGLGSGEEPPRIPLRVDEDRLVTGAQQVAAVTQSGGAKTSRSILGGPMLKDSID
jgi:hypothetical protein